MVDKFGVGPLTLNRPSQRRLTPHYMDGRSTTAVDQPPTSAASDTVTVKHTSPCLGRT